MLSRRIALLLLPLAVAGLAFAAVASSHSLTKTKAQTVAQKIGNKKVKDSDGDYVQATAYGCTKSVPHRVACYIGYHDKESLAAPRKNGKKKWACYDIIEFLYKAHDDREKPDYTVYKLRPDTYNGNGKFQNRGGC